MLWYSYFIIFIFLCVALSSIHILWVDKMEAAVCESVWGRDVNTNPALLWRKKGSHGGLSSSLWAHQPFPFCHRCGQSEPPATPFGFLGQDSEFLRVQLCDQRGEPRVTFRVQLQRSSADMFIKQGSEAFVSLWQWRPQVHAIVRHHSYNWRLAWCYSCSGGEVVPISSAILLFFFLTVCNLFGLNYNVSLKNTPRSLSLRLSLFSLER